MWFSRYRNYHTLNAELGAEKSRISLRRLLYGFIVSVLFNIIFLGYILFHWHSRTDQPVTRFAGLSEKIGIHRTTTEFSNSNITFADEKWDSLDTNPGTITLPDEFAEAHGIRVGARFPWDESQGLYVIKGFHELHCLKAIRKSFREYQQNIPQTQNGGHILHCLDNLRQGIMCTASDDLIPVVPSVVDVGLNMQCHSWDELTRWAMESERHACYNYIDEYRHAKHEIERFGFCPESSRYYASMKGYFDANGHRDPWVA